MSQTLRSDLPEPLSGLPEPAVVELGHGLPWLTLSEMNRLVRQQGVASALARAWLLDQLVRAIPLRPEREQELLESWKQRKKVPLRPEDFKNWLERQRLQSEDLLAMATQAERLERFRRFHWREEVELEFLQRKPSLDQVVYRMLRVSDRSLAEELHQRIVDGEAELAELASEHAEGQERNTAGRIGPLPMTTAHPEIVQRLRVSKPGQIWPPFAVNNVWVVLQLEQLLPARLDEAMNRRLLDDLFEQWLKNRLQLLLAGEPLPPLPAMPREDEPVLTE